jgi:hypothetical protein
MNTNNKKIFALACAAMALLTASPVAALVRTVTYSGQFASGLDVTGIFLPAGSDLSGHAYAAAFTYDTNLGSIRSATATYDIIYGGDGFGGVSPLIDATLSINGTTRHVSGSSSAVFRTIEAEAITSSAIHQVESNGIQYSGHIAGAGNASTAAASLDSNVAASPFGSTTFGAGSFQFYVYDLGASQYLERAYGNFASTGTFSVTGGVPEPASWAMLITGFGLTGTALRRRAKSIATA